MTSFFLHDEIDQKLPKRSQKEAFSFFFDPIRLFGSLLFQIETRIVQCCFHLLKENRERLFAHS